MLPPSGPVTNSQSPGFAPARVTGPRPVASPSTVTEIDERTVPAVGVAADDGDVERVGHVAEAEVELFGERSPAAFAAAPRSTTAATGMPAIAAMSLRFAAIALRPTRRGPTSATTKSVPSISMSVVTSSGRSCGASTAQSSPGPISTRGSAGVRDRSHAM